MTVDCPERVEFLMSEAKPHDIHITLVRDQVSQVAEGQWDHPDVTRIYFKNSIGFVDVVGDYYTVLHRLCWRK